VVGQTADQIQLAPLGNYGGPTQTLIALPGSPAICAGSVANISVDTVTDERGFPNTNTTYPGYSAGTPCVDSGAVQTNYAITFSTLPSPIAPATSIYNNSSFQAAVTLNESGTSGPSGVSIPLTLNGSGTLTGGRASASAGIANYSALQVNAANSNDSLTATLSLNAGLTTPLALTVTSPSFAVASSAPSAVSVTPSSGFGMTQQFTFVASDPNGAENIAALSMLFNTGGTHVNACNVFYFVKSNQFALLSDDGNSSTGGTSGVHALLSNSQCSVNLSTSGVAFNGNTLTATPTVTFKSGFMGGVRVFLNVADINNINSGGWKQLGWWMVGPNPEMPPVAASVTPSSGAGITQRFDFVATDPGGVGSIAGLSMLFNTSGTRVNGCNLLYYAPANQLLLASDDGTSWSTGQPMGTGSLENSQCSVDLSATTVTPTSHTSLMVSPTITFKSGFTAGVRIFLNVADFAGMSSGGWKQLGWWVVGTGTEMPPTADSVTPSSGTGMSQQFSFQASSSLGAANLNGLSMLFNTTVTRVNGCNLVYYAPANQLQLASDDGTSWTTGTVGDSGTLSNSQCSVDLFNTTVIPSGNSLTVEPTITFTSSFLRPVHVYLNVADVPGMSSGGWKQLGTWTP
jgi:uncharacterized membrane protein